MNSDWYKNVNPNLDRLAEILGMGNKPSHGYTISEKGPEVVTAPGVYFPAEKGNVIPLQPRQEGGSVVPPLHKDDDRARLEMLNSLISMIKPSGLESRASGGSVIPPQGELEKLKIEQSKYDILKSAISVLKPQGEKIAAPDSGSSTPGPKPSTGEPTLPKPPSSMINLPTAKSYGVLPDAMKPSKENTPLIPRQTGGTVTPSTDEDDKLRRIQMAINPSGEPGVSMIPQTPEALELAAREKWAAPGYAETALTEARKIAPNTVAVTPGFERGYYEAHPEERFIEAAQAASKPALDMSQKLIDETRARAQGFGLPMNPRAAREMRAQAAQELPSLMAGHEKLVAEGAAAPSEALKDITRPGPKGTAPHLIKSASGEYVWATPGGVLPAGVMGTTAPPKAPGAPHPHTTEGGTIVSDPTQGGRTMYLPPSGGPSEPYDPKKHGEVEVPGVISNEDSKMYAQDLASGKMTPSMLRLVVQPFGAAGGQTKNKIFKNLREINPDYNFKLAEAEYAADTKSLTNLSNLFSTAQVAMGAAENHGKQILELSSKVDRTGSPVINRWIVGGKKQIAGDKDVNDLDIAIHAYDREFSRYLSSMTPGGLVAQGEAEAMKGLINSARTPEQLIGAVQTTQALMQGKKDAFSDQFTRIKSSLGGQGGQPTPAPAPPKVWKVQPDGSWKQE